MSQPIRTVALSRYRNENTSITPGSITTTEIANNTITAANIAPGTITTTEIANNTITTADLATTAVTPGAYTNSNITVGADGRITAATSGYVIGTDIADGFLAGATFTSAAIDQAIPFTGTPIGTSISDNGFGTFTINDAGTYQVTCAITMTVGPASAAYLRFSVGPFAPLWLPLSPTADQSSTITYTKTVTGGSTIQVNLAGAAIQILGLSGGRHYSYLQIVRLS